MHLRVRLYRLQTKLMALRSTISRWILPCEKLSSVFPLMRFAGSNVFRRLVFPAVACTPSQRQAFFATLVGPHCSSTALLVLLSKPCQQTDSRSPTASCCLLFLQDAVLYSSKRLPGASFSHPPSLSPSVASRDCHSLCCGLDV